MSFSDQIRIKDIAAMLAVAVLCMDVAAGGSGTTELQSVVCRSPSVIWTNNAGRVVHDFGKDAFGWAEVRLASKTCTTAAVIEVMLGEKSDGCGVDMEPGGSVRAARCRVGGLSPNLWQRVPMKADERNTGEHAIKMPSKIGVVMPFRYVETPIGVEVRRMAVAVPMDMSASSFNCSDAKLNEVYEFCKYTILATSFAGLYIDGDRERIPYEADSYINMLGEQAVWADGEMARASMLHLLDNPTWPTEWQLHMPMMAHGYWMSTGDIEPIRTNYARLKRLLLRDMARESDGLLVTQWERKEPLCDIVDWPRCERDGFVFTNVNSVVNAFHIRALRDMAQLSSALGEKDDADIFAKEAEAKIKAFRSAFVDEDTGLVRDGEGVAHSSIHANIAAIAFGLLPQAIRDKVMEHVRSRGMACSTYFSQYLLEASFAAGCGEYARALMTADGDRSWLGMKKAGATMCMESWSGAVKPNQDWSHAWSAAPLNIISRFVLGVRPLEPGARKIAIEPDLCGMEFMDGSVPTASGVVKISADASNLVVETPVPAHVVWQDTIHEVAPGRHEFNCKQAAVASAVSLKTGHFQRQIDIAAAQGGGRVVVPAGRHVVGQIDLKSNVELHLERGAVLEGAVGLENYRITELPYSEGTWSAVVSAIGVTNVAVTGEGEIFGNGAAWPQPENYGGNQEGLRPRGLFFADCNDIRLSDFTLRDAACWGVVFKCCDGVDVRRIKIDSHANANNDGFDVEAKNVVIVDCDIDTGDDAICLKSNNPQFAVENLFVSNVVARSHCCAFKLGTASHGTMRNVLFTDCLAQAPRRDFPDRRRGREGLWFVNAARAREFPGVGANEQSGMSAIAIENVDGGTVENIVFRRIYAYGTCVPLFIRAGTRNGRACGTPPSDKYIFRNVLIEDVSGESLSAVASSITGVDGCRIKNVTLRNVWIVCRGGGETAAERIRPVPELAGQYPNAHMFGCILPAYGLYARHVDGLSLESVSFELQSGTTDARESVFLDDVTSSPSR